MATRKFFIRNILRQVSLIQEQIVIDRRPIEFVWIQGIIAHLDADAREMILDDGTDTLLVSTEDLVQGIHDISVGSYVMIQGIVIVGEDDFGKVVLVRARLLYDLSPSVTSDVNMETLWQYEVMESLRDFTQTPVLTT